MATTIQTRASVVRMAVQDKNLIYKRNIRYSTINEEQLIDAASRNSQIGRGVLRAAYEAVLNEFENFLLNGHSVELPGLGHFRFAIQAKAPKDVEKVGTENIKRRKINFAPNAAIKAELNAITFDNVNDDDFAEEGGNNAGTDDGDEVS